MIFTNRLLSYFVATQVLLIQWNSCLARTFDYHTFIDGKCSDAETKRELYIGEYFHRPGQCIRVQCLGDLTIWEDKCNDPQIKGNCIKEYLNINEPYPNCCPLYKCENHFGSSKEIKVFDHYGSIISRSITNIVMVEDNGIGGGDSRDHIQTIKVRI